METYSRPITTETELLGIWGQLTEFEREIIIDMGKTLIRIRPYTDTPMSEIIGRRGRGGGVGVYGTL